MRSTPSRLSCAGAPRSIAQPVIPNGCATVLEAAGWSIAIAGCDVATVTVMCCAWLKPFATVLNAAMERRYTPGGKFAVSEKPEFVNWLP